MADKEIPTLTDASTPLDGTETTIITQDGDSREVSLQQIADDLIPSGYAGYQHIRVFADPVDTTPALNSATYSFINFCLQVPIDLAAFPFTHFRWFIRGQSNAAAQTVTVQLDSGTTGAAPAKTGGDDLVITNTVANFDSGWLARADALTGFQVYRMLLKGSNSTVDLTVRHIDLLLKIDP
jgi:hypothetical protein